MEPLSRKRERATRIARILAEWYPSDTETALAFRDPFELLVATILAAQCTDERVNQVAPRLFERFPDPNSLARADPSEVEEIIRSTGFFKAKTRHILACCQRLVEVHGGRVPSAMEDLTALPGVGRKTANVIRTNSFGLPGIVVDTHVLRLAGRLGLSERKVADEVEADLMDLLPESEWSAFSHRLTWLGRRVCGARRPRCDECRLRPECPTGRKGATLVSSSTPTRKGGRTRNRA